MNPPMETTLTSAAFGYVPADNLDMLDDMSWPCDFRTPVLPQLPQSISPYPTSPASMTASFSNIAKSFTLQQLQLASPTASNYASDSSFLSKSPSPHEGYAVVVQQPPRLDRERRKAQNRASQRAYRERKEVQLKDLAVSLKNCEKVVMETKKQNEHLEAEMVAMQQELVQLRDQNITLKCLSRKQQQPRESQVEMGRPGQDKECGTGLRTPPNGDEGLGDESKSESGSYMEGPADFSMLEGVDWDDILQFTTSSRELEQDGTPLG